MSPAKIHSPVKGDWKFMNPPGHHPDAKDFVAVNENGNPYKLIKFLRHVFYKLPVEDTYAWEKDIYSPFEGEVIEVHNGAKDRQTLNILQDLMDGLFVGPRRGKGDIKYFLGNFIIIKSLDGIYALFAHLRKGSIRVEKGEHVMCGEALAKIGNSGNTIQPHLHFQIMQEWDPDLAVPIPFIFEYSTPYPRNGKPENVIGLPRNYQHFRV